MINYEETPEFGRDFKKLQKRFKSLGEDIAVVKKAVIELYHLQNIDNRAVFPIPQFCCDTVRLFKIKKFACKALKGRGVQSGIRVIYAYFPGAERVVFLEIYFKQDQEDMDLRRARGFLKRNLRDYARDEVVALKSFPFGITKIHVPLLLAAHSPVDSTRS
jgi:hypothetical protein